MSTVNTTINHGITFGTGGYASPLTITNSGAINNHGTGPAVFGGTGTVVNDGHIIATSRTATTTTAGTIHVNVYSYSGVYLSDVGASLNNSGAITASLYAVQFTTGGSVTNSGVMYGGKWGIESRGLISITNSGTVSGGSQGIVLSGGGFINNSKLITGTDGIGIGGAAGTVDNSGTIASYGAGVAINAGGVVSNTGTGLISVSGSYAAVYVTGGAGTVTNASTLSGSTGVSFVGTYNNTLTNSGTIIGSGGTAVAFSDGNDLMKLTPSTLRIQGTVDGGGGSNTLEFASAASIGTLTGVGADFNRFTTGTVDIGARWVLAGDISLASSVTLNNAGTLTDTGTLRNAGLISGRQGAANGAGGLAITVAAAAILSNSGTITGGAGGNGAGSSGRSGANAVNVTSGTLINSGTIAGGMGGVGAAHTPGGYAGGTGGIGVQLVSASLTNTSMIVGGAGGVGGASGTGPGIGGYGGVGLLITTSTVNNAGTITGGRGGTGGASTGNPGSGYGGVGGFGVSLVSGGFTNSSIITGGAGGAAGAGGSSVGGEGADGLYVNAAGANVTNTGTIVGGSGGAGTGADGPGLAGAGVFFRAGGTLTNSGFIGRAAFGNPGQGYAVYLGSNTSKLILNPGASFSGAVWSNASFANVLELASAASVGTLNGLGTNFTNFRNDTVDAGAHWVLAGSNTLASNATLTDLGTLTIAGTLTAAGIAVHVAAGGALTNAGTGVVSGTTGITASGTVSISNLGSITGTSATGIDANASSGNLLLLSNASGGVISGASYGVRAGYTTLTNRGTIRATGTHSEGVLLAAAGNDGIITNYGVLTGTYYGIHAIGDGSLNNSGTISSSGRYGVRFDGGTPSVTNSGTISATNGLVMLGAGTVSNSGLITGLNALRIAGIGTVVNSAAISASSGTGIALSAGGTISNAAAGVITGVSYNAIDVQGGVATVTNAGTIVGGTGITFSGTFNNTVTDSGRIAGTNGTAIAFDTGNDLLKFTPSASVSIQGLVDGGGGTNTLEFASAATTGTLTGTGASFANFTKGTVDSGASWRFAGSNTIGTGTTLIDSGSVTISGRLVNSASIALGVASLSVASGGYLLNNTSGLITGITGHGSSTAPAVVGLAGGASTAVNLGTISDSQFNFGVRLLAGGSVTNGSTSDTTALVFAQVPIYIAGAAGTISNFGTLESNPTPGGTGGITMAAGGTVSNGAAGSTAALISGAYNGIVVNTGVATVTNFGTIDAAAGKGVLLQAGGTVTDAGTIIGGGGTAVTFAGTNAGRLILDAGYSITGLVVGSASASNTLELASTGSTGTLSGLGTKFTNFNFETIDVGANWTFTGSNSITSTTSLTNFGTLTDTGTITGGITLSGSTALLSVASGGTLLNDTRLYAVYSYTGGISSGTVLNAGYIGGTKGGLQLGGLATVSNSGTIQVASTAENAVALLAGGLLTNSGLIHDSSYTAVGLYGNTSLNNTGTISSTNANNAIYVRSGSGTITNAGLISSTGRGVFFSSFGTVTNSGTIYGAIRTLDFSAGGSVSNAATGLLQADTTHAVINVEAAGAVTVTNAGTLAALEGIIVDAANASNQTVIDSGTIIASGGTAIAFSTGNDLMKLVPGGLRIQGLVDGGAGTNTLEFASGASAGTLTGLGASFVNFSAGTVDAGASWVLAGSNTVGTGTTLTNSGTLTDAGTLVNRGTITAAGASNGVLLATGASFTNFGLVSATNYGVHATGALAATLTNYGTIRGTTNFGVVLGGGGTLIDAGTITSAGTAVSFGGTGQNLLVLENGYAFSGNIRGSASASNTVELLGTSSASAVVATYNNLSLTNFGTIAFAPGNSNYATLKLTNNSTLPGTIAGFIGSHDTIDLTTLSDAGNNATTSFNTASNKLTVTAGTASVTLQLDSENYTNIGWIAKNDGSGGTKVTATTVSPVTIGGTKAGQTVNDNATDHPFSTVTITDTNPPTQTETLTITLSNGGTATDADGTLSGTGLSKTGTGVYTLTASGPAAAASALQALVFTPTTNQVAPSGTVTTAFKLALTDSTGQSTSDSTTTVIATSVNDAPTLAGTAAGQTVNDNATDHPFSAATITDPDVGASETVTITLKVGGVASDANGALSGTGLSKTGVGTYKLTAGTPASVTTALRALVFTPTAHEVAPGSTATTGMTLSVTDGIVGSPTTDATTTVVATAVNDPPVIAGTAAGQTVNDNATDHPFSAVTISDPDSGASETITITLKAGAVASDANGIMSGSGLSKTGVGTYTLTAGTPASVTAALRALLFTPTANEVAPGSTVTTGMTLSVTDGIVGSPTTDSKTTVVATSVNDAPSIAGTAAGLTVNDNATDHPFSAVTVSDADIGASETVTITLKVGGVASDANGTLSGSGLSKIGVGTYTLTAGTPASVSTALRALLFTPTANEVAPGSTVTTGMTLSVTDGIAGSPTTDATTTVVATSVNDAPAIAGTTAGQTVNDNASDHPFSSATISDPDFGASETVTITLTASGVTSDANGTLSGSGLSKIGVGTYKLTAGTPGSVTTALHALAFAPTAHQVAPGSTVTTGMTLSVSDGIAGSPTTNSTTTVVATAVSNAPVIAGTDAGQTVNDNATEQPFSAVTISDPNGGGQSETVTITLTNGGTATDADGVLSGSGLTKTGTGTYSLTGTPAAVTATLQALVFTPTQHQVVPGSTVTTAFNLAVVDTAGQSAGDSTTTVIATSVNDAPVIVGTAAGQTVTDKATDQPFSGVTVSDPDFSASEAVTITLKAGGAASDANGTLAGTGLTHTGVGTYTLSAGSPAAVTSALRALVFTPTANEVAPGSTVTTAMTLSVNDGFVGSPTTDSTTTVVATSVNDAPAIAGTAAGQKTNDNATDHPFSVATISDPDFGASETVTVTLTAGGVASDANGTLSGSGLTKTGVGTYKLTAGTPASVTTALRALLFTPTAHEVAPGSTVTTGMTLSVTDGIVGSPTTNATTTVVTTSVNDPPVITGTAAGQTVNDNATDHPFSATTISDPDVGASETVTITLKAGGVASDANGVLSGSGLSKTGVGTYKLTAGTPASVTTALRALVFTPTANEVAPGSTVTTGMTLSVTDGIVGSPTTDATTSVVATSVNDAPTIAGTAAGQTVNDNTTDQPFSTVTIGDPDAGASETVTITLTAGGVASDANGTLAGSGLSKTGVGTYKLAAGTPAAVTTALRALLFTPTVQEVAPGDTVTTGITLSATDGIAGSPTTDSTTTVVATAVGNAPVIAGATAGHTVNDNASDQPFAAVTISDPNGGGQTDTITITVSNAGTATDADGLLIGAGLTKTGTGTYTLSGTPASVTATLQALVFSPTANQVAPAGTVTTAFTLAVTDTAGQSASNSATTVIATSVNDAPTIAGTEAGQAVTDNATDHPFSAVTISDPDVGANETVTVTLKAGGVASDANGTLAGAGLSKTGVGTYKLAAGTPAAVTSALQALVFTPKANEVAPGGTVTTGMTVSVTDGIVGSPTVNSTTTVVATSVNDAPVIAGTKASQTVNDNGTDRPFSAVTVSDPDAGASELVTITLNDSGTPSDANGTLSGSGLTHAGVGTYKLAAGTPVAVTAALQALVFTPTDNQVTPGDTVTTGFTLSVTDGIVGTPTTDATTTVVATAVGNALAISGTAAGQAVSDNATEQPFSGVTISDPNAGSPSETVTITLSNGGIATDADGLLSGPGLTYTGIGTYTLSATDAASATSALRALQFTPTAQQVAPGDTVTTTFTIAVSDSAGQNASDDTTTVVATSVNDPPTIAGTTAGQTVNDDSTDQPFATTTISDPDVGATETVTITLTSGGIASDDNGTLSGSGLTQTGVGTYTLAADTPDGVTAALQALVFTPTMSEVPPGGSVTTGMALSVDDGIAGSPTTDVTTTVVATAVGNALTIDGTAAGLSVNDNATEQPFSGVTITDPNAGSPSTNATITLTNGGLATDDDGTLSGVGLTQTDVGTYTLAASDPAAMTAALQALVFTPTAHQVAPGSTVTTTFALVVGDSLGESASDSTTSVVATSINDAPVIAGTVAGQTVDDSATDQPFATTTISDPDVGAVETVTITLQAAGVASDDNGTLSGSGLTKTGIGTYTLTADTPDAVTAALQALVFTPTFNEVPLGGTVTTSMILSVTDGIVGAPVTDTATTVVATAAGNGLLITGTTAGQSVDDNATAQPFAGVTVTDPNTGSPLESAAITLTSNGIATDDNGTLSGDGLTQTGVGTYTLSATDPTALTAALQALVFTPTADQVVPGDSVTTDFTLVASDSLGESASDDTTSVVATSVNDPPAIAGTAAGQTVNDNATDQPFAAATISDSDVGANETVTITLTTGGVASDANGTLSGSGLTHTGVGTYALTPDTPSAVTAELDALVFTPTAHLVAPGSTVTTGMTLSVSDGLAASPTTDSTTTVVATAVGNALTISGTAPGQTVNDNATERPFSAVTIVDPNAGSLFETVTITLSNGGTATDADGTLSGTGLGKIGVGTYTLSATDATAAASALQALVFTPTPHQVVPGGMVTTTFTLAVTDTVGEGASDSTTTVVATSVNDPPVIAGTVAGLAVSDDATNLPFATATISDPDVGASETVAVTLTAGGIASDANGTLSGSGLTQIGVGTYTLSAGSPAAVTAALQALVFAPTDHEVTPGDTVTTGMTLSVTDGIVGSPTTDSITTVMATALNDAPGISGTVAGQTVNDNATDDPFSGVTITDPDFGATETVTLTLTGGDANGTLLGTGLAKTGAGSYMLASGTPSAVTAELQALVFTPTAHEVPPGGTVTTGMTLSVTDGIVGSPVTDATTSVIATALSDVPSITHLVTDIGTPNELVLTPFAGIGISNPDVGEIVTVTVTLSNAAGGTLSNVGTGSFNATTGVYTVTGTSGAVSTTLEGLSFTPAPPVDGLVSTTRFTIVVNGPGGTASDSSISVTAVQQILALAGIPVGNDAISVSPDGTGFAPPTDGKSNQAVISDPASGGSYTLPTGYQAVFLGGTADASLSDATGGNALLIGNTGNDTITAGAANDTIVSGTGTNILNASGTSDVVGVNGPATVSTSGNADTVFAGTGNATLLDSGSNDALGLGTGTDAVTLTGSGAQVYANTGAASIVDAGTADVIGGYTGALAVTLSGSDATVFGGSGALTVDVTSSAVNARIGLSAGPATLNLNGSGTEVFGGSGSLSVTDTGSNDTIAAGSGATRVTAGGSGLVVVGSSGSLGVIEGVAPATVFGGSGSATVTGGSGATTLYGSAGGTISFVGNNAMTYQAGAGNETLNAAGASSGAIINGGIDRAGGNSLVGGSGNDSLFAGTGADALTGGAGANEFVWYQSVVNGSAPQDMITDFNANDTVIFAGYGADAASAALAGAQSSGGATTLTLTDNTQITFLNMSSVNALTGHVFST